MWLMAMAVTLGCLGIFAFTARAWSGARRRHLGCMSEQWLGEHRTGIR